MAGQSWLYPNVHQHDERIHLPGMRKVRHRIMD